ncbi:MAG: hypothetical protein IKN15_12465 [Bacteroidaceae bacterium]|nr:hypothetical protein [Bacteroidaceae bacterium]
MKTIKLLIISAAAVVMTSCGNNKTGNGEEADSVDVASVEAATANSELWTEEAVEKQVREMFDAVNEQFQSGNGIDCGALDRQYCTKYYLSCVDRIYQYDEENGVGDMYFMGDECWHWCFDIMPPFVVENVKVDLLSGDQAQAQVRLVSGGVGKAADDEDEYTSGTTMILWLEDGQWKVNNWLDPEVYADNGYLGMMEDYIRENNIPE